MTPEIAEVGQDIIANSRAAESAQTVIARAESANQAPQDQEARLARAAIQRSSPEFTPELRRVLVQEVLVTLAAEKSWRLALKLNHWDERAPRRIAEIVEQLLAERRDKVAAYLAANIEGLRELAWRVTRDAGLAEQAVTQTACELWVGRTREAVCYRALKMNARDLLGKRATKQRREESLEAHIATDNSRTDGLTDDCADESEAADFPSSRLEDQDPLDILIARQEQAETNAELEYALRVVRYPGNRGVLEKKWWKGSALGALEKDRHAALVASARMEKRRFRVKSRTDSGGSPE